MVGYISLRNPFHLIKYTLIWEFFVKLREAISWSYGLRFSKTRTLFRVFFRDERNGIARFPLIQILELNSASIYVITGY